MEHKLFDVVVCGSCVVDVLARPVSLDQPIGAGRLVRTDPLMLTTGGIVSNAGITLARLGMRVAALTYRGQDEWGELIASRYAHEGIDTSQLIPHPSYPTSTTAVLIDQRGERSFLHAVGAPKRIDRSTLLDRLEVFAKSRAMLLGYFSLLPNLQGDLPEVLSSIQGTGCLTAIDAAGDGGTLHDLCPCLPYLDVYVPSFKEAQHQTGCSDPEQMIALFRQAGAAGIVGVKLGDAGALLADRQGQLIDVPAVPPPGEVVDTTGAGDSFVAGLLCGLLLDMSLAAAGRLAAACGARCVTALGATTAMGNFESTLRLADLDG